MLARQQVVSDTRHFPRTLGKSALLSWVPHRASDPLVLHRVIVGQLLGAGERVLALPPVERERNDVAIQRYTLFPFRERRSCLATASQGYSSTAKDSAV